MQDTHIPPPPKPILTRAAENGAWLNLYISVLVLALGFGVRYPVATLILWIGSLALPVVVYRMLRKSQTQASNTLSFPELWAEGIATFMLGTLVPAVVAYVALRFFVPSFMADTLSYAVSVLQEQGTAQAQEMADMMRHLSQKKMPTPVDVSSQIISFNIIVGTFLSLVLAGIVKIRTPRRNRSALDKM